MATFGLFPVFGDLAELLSLLAQDGWIRNESVIDLEIGHLIKLAPLSCSLDVFHFLLAKLARQRESIAQVHVLVIWLSLFDELAGLDAGLSPRQVEGLLQIADQDDDVGFLAEISFLSAYDAFHLEHLQPVEGEPAQLNIGLEVRIHELRNFQRMILVSMFDHNLDVQSWLGPLGSCRSTVFLLRHSRLFQAVASLSCRNLPEHDR